MELLYKNEKCHLCQGQGKIKETRRSFLGAFTSVRACDNCLGKGEIPEKKCKECRGQGVLKKSEEVVVNIPAGIEDNEIVKLSGAGEAVQAGIAGDLYVKIHVLPHPVFQKQGSNLLMDMDVKFSEAILGAKREIPTLDGNLTIKIPKGIDSGEILRVRGKGVPTGPSQRGDLLIKTVVKTPKSLSRKAKRLIEELQQEGV